MHNRTQRATLSVRYQFATQYGTCCVSLININCDRTSGIKTLVSVKTAYYIILQIFRFSDVWYTDYVMLCYVMLCYMLYVMLYAIYVICYVICYMLYVICYTYVMLHVVCYVM
jgi:hypothetical protein